MEGSGEASDGVFWLSGVVKTPGPRKEPSYHVGMILTNIHCRCGGFLLEK